MDSTSSQFGPTRQIAEWIAGEESVSDAAITCARHALLDWTGVTFAASRDVMANILVEDAIGNSETGTCGVVGRKQKLSQAFAALVNGSVSHALDYDDINKRMRGHPSVTIMPAVLAAAESRECVFGDVLEAIVAGTEVACILGEMMGGDHYEKGFHTTATVGTVAAAASVAKLLGLGASDTEAALGLAATQAAGLRAMFGTMGKPLHAGKAAMNGLLSARWAGSGMTSTAGMLESPQGFGPVLSAGFQPLPIRTTPEIAFGIEQNIYKYHAACYYTHSAIEMLANMVRENGIETERILSLDVGLLPSLHTVCDIQKPASGLEIKFSIRHLLAMVIADVNTSDIGSYTDECAADATLVALRSKVNVIAENFESRTASRITLRLRDGNECSGELDIGVPATNLAEQQDRLSEKFHSLVAPVIGESASHELQRVILFMDSSTPPAGLLSRLYTGAEE